jgi:toxin HigB-1
VEISFADKKLEKLSLNYSKCRQKMGDKRAKLFITRLNALHDAVTLEDIRHYQADFMN